MKKGRRKKPNYIYSIISVAIALFVLGFFILLVEKSHQLVVFFKEQVNILVEIKPSASSDDIARLKDFLQQHPYIKKGSLQFLPKEEGMKVLREDFGEEFQAYDFTNPLYDMFRFNVRAAFGNSDSLRSLTEIVAKKEGVSDVFYQENLLQQFEENIGRLGWVALGCSLLFLLIAFILIHNTIRLAIYSNRFLIKNMEMVGASWRFIVKPYLLQSLLHGLFSGLLASLALAGLLTVVYRNLPELEAFQNYNVLFFLILGLIILGILLTLMSTYFTVNKYLKMRLDDLY